MTLRWHRLSPVPLVDPTFRALAAKLLEPEFRDRLAEEEAAGRYPLRSLDALREVGLSELFAGGHDPAQPLFTTHHIYGLNALVARENGSLGITVGVIMLGLLPVHLGANESQLRELLARVRGGAAVALLLTEWERGSDLKTNETSAERGTFADGRFEPRAEGFDHYRVAGEKRLINGAAQSELLVTLVRTQSSGAADGGLLGAAADMSVLVISPGAGVEQLPRHETLPMRAAEIGGVRFGGAIVPAARRLGEEGQGFALMQRALAFSRGGIGALASGTTSRAFALARAYAHERVLYGAPIAALDPIAEHLVRVDALDLCIACLSIKAACLANELGPAAAHHTAIAKYACCELAEQAVDEGRRVLSSRALLSGAYEEVLRDVLLYAVFDGTRHVMLQQIQWRLRQLVARRHGGAEDEAGDVLRRAYAAAPVGIAEVGRRRAPAHVPDPVRHARFLERLPGDVDMAPLVALAEGLREVTLALIERRLWDTDQNCAFTAGRVLALLETAFAVAELADPKRRVALGMPPLDEPGATERARYAIGFVAGSAAAELDALAASARLEASASVLRAQRAAWAMTGSARGALRSLVRETGSDETTA